MTEFQSLKQILLITIVILPRILAAFAVIPFLGSQILPGMVRNSIVISLTLVLHPLVGMQVPEDPALPFLMAVVAKEVALGILIGFMTGLFFWAVESVGYVIDNQRGTTMASVLNPMSGEQTSPLGSMLMQLVTVLFFSGGGFLVLLGGLFRSYQTWPVFQFLPSPGKGFPLFFLQQADTLMAMIVVFAAPILIAIFVAEFALGLVNRFAPQLNVFFLAMPIKSGIAGFLLIFYTYFLLFYFKGQMADYGNLIGNISKALL